MCGICGIIGPQTRTGRQTARTRVEAMIGALAHRGPDASGLVEADDAVIGATRLAVRGLDDGTQPIVDPETGLVAVCNGEIDNHRELRTWLEGRGRSVPSATDVAVIPGLCLELGEAFVERLVGAFAIAVWDPRHSRLLLARDRAGERPIFYVRRGDEIAFATELSAFVADRDRAVRIDRAALTGYLRTGAFIAPETPFVGIRKVAPGGVVVVEHGEWRERRYWRWPVGDRAAAEPTLDDLDRGLTEAVRRQTDIDVRFGVFLSGGLDSSLVAAVARRVRPGVSIPAFTVRFAEASYDEGAFAERVARTLGLEHASVLVRPEDYPAEIRRLVSLVGEPLADPAWVPTAMLARLAASSVTVALVGEGADELFGGYPTYIGVELSPRYAALPRPVRRLAEAIVRRLPPSDRKVPLSFLLRRFVEGARLAGPERHRLWTAAVTPDVLGRLVVAEPTLRAEPPPSGELLDWVQAWDLETSLAEGLLTKADRAAMSHALELRAPYLDAAVMGLAARLRPESRVRGLRTKVALKGLAERYLPTAIVHRRKRGLSVPLAPWLRGPLAGWARDRLLDERLGEVGIDRQAAVALLDEHRTRRRDHSRAIWSLIVLSEWLAWLGSAGAGTPASGEQAPRLVASGGPRGT